MKKIYVFWYKYKKGNGNFGDELNPYLIGKLSDAKIKYINLKYLNDNKEIAIKVILNDFFRNEISLFDAIIYLGYNFLIKPRVILGIGSVLHLSRYSKCIVWGSGLISSKTIFPNAEFRAVRGKYSQKKINKLGYKGTSIIGDPSLLLPLIYKPRINKKYKIGIIPHYVHFPEMQKIKFDSDVLLLNLLQDVETVIQQILSCEITLSSSLHGIIVSHAYGIPSLWVNFQDYDCKLEGDNIKFNDYFSSVQINEYLPVELNSNGSIIELKKMHIFDTNLELSEFLPEKKVIEKIQIDLLSVAPFSMSKKEWKQFL